MKPVTNRVLLKVSEAVTPETKIGGLVFQEKTPESEKAEVIEVGDEVKELKAGDNVLIYPEAGKKITVDGEKYRVVTLNEIIVIL